MTETLSTRLARALASAGADTMFGLPGGGPNLDVIGAALAADLRFVLAHGETEAAIMASTYGRLTGQPTPVVVTRGPGAASVVNGCAQATLDRYPLVVVTDTVPASQATRVPHQRVDQRAMLGPAAKVSATISDRSFDQDLFDLIDEATTWPWGAVHLDFDPSAELSSDVDVAPPQATVNAAGLEAARELLANAVRPVVLVGLEASSWSASGAEGCWSALSRFDCPVLTTYQAVGIVPTEEHLNAGLFTNGALERPLLEEADLIVALGLDEVEPIPAGWPVDTPVLRLSTLPQESPYFVPALDVVAPVDDLLSLLPARVSTSWSPNAAAEFRTSARHRIRPEQTSAFGPLQVVNTAAAARPDALTTTVDAGAHFLAVMPNWPVAEPDRLLISNGLATMGFAVPAAIGAALARPGEPVLALTGDGGMAMVLAELETIVRLALPVTVLVFNDAALSLIEIKQEPEHGGEQTVRFDPVDFAAMGRAVGMRGVVVDSVGSLEKALADDWGTPRLIDARIDPGDYRHLIEATRG